MPTSTILLYTAYYLLQPGDICFQFCFDDRRVFRRQNCPQHTTCANSCENPWICKSNADNQLTSGDVCYKFCGTNNELVSRRGDCPPDAPCTYMGPITCRTPWICQRGLLMVGSVCYKFCNDENSAIFRDCPTGTTCESNSVSTCSPPWTCKTGGPLEPGDICYQDCINQGTEVYIDRSAECPAGTECIKNGLGHCDPPHTCQENYWDRLRQLSWISEAPSNDATNDKSACTAHRRCEGIFEPNNQCCPTSQGNHLACCSKGATWTPSVRAVAKLPAAVDDSYV
eukprot:GEMP01043022.1.p1 GENE.GEMP01043022.1~~GEMP01043022.1.p1  ORF type:complete len:284 (+),score=45.01 GEMP01043022.1:50-901(+)